MSLLPYYLYKVSNYLDIYKLSIFSKCVVIFNRLLFGAYIPSSCILGKKVRFGYGGSGVVLHGRCIVGSGTIICPGVVIGGTSKSIDVPKVGDNCFLGAGAKIIGPITIGSNVFVAPNSVVTKSIPCNSLAVGIPAKVIKTNININDYIG